MKLGILTQPLNINYGGLLQNYALQQVLIRAGHEVETIDWHPRKVKRLRVCLSRVKWAILSAILPHKYKKPKFNYAVTDKDMATIRRDTNHFIDAYILHTSPMQSLDGFARQSKKGQYEGYIVGSDQCWRPKYNSFIPAMFLSFARDKDVKRIAYAASFGTDTWEFTPEMASLCAPLAQKFDLVTVREDSGVKLCKEYLGVEATQVLDPTMLLTKEDYIRLIEAEKESKSAGTLFNYILDPDERKTAFIIRVAKEMNLRPFQVLPKYQAETRAKEDVKTRIEDCVYPGVTTWLRAFLDAEMTIVDSFHGMVFSILFNKPFWVIGNAKRGLSRFSSLLKIFALEDRLLYVDDLDRVDYNRPIDWRSVNGRLEQKRDESKNLLINSLQ